MAKPKSIVEKFTDTMKGLADTASQALKAEEPPRLDETAAGYMPFAAEGLVSDPMLPVAAQPVRKRRPAKKAAGRAGKSSSKSAAKTSARKAAGKKAASRPASARAKAATGKSARKTKTMKQGGSKGRKKSR
jgi:hypothetical protein